MSIRNTSGYCKIGEGHDNMTRNKEMSSFTVTFLVITALAVRAASRKTRGIKRCTKETKQTKLCGEA